MHDDETARLRRTLPETRRAAAVIRGVRVENGLTRETVAAATAAPVRAIAAMEDARAGVPCRYAGRLIRRAGIPAAVVVDRLFAPADWPADPARFAPLPADARLMESALRLWRLEPHAANASLRDLLEGVLANAPRRRSPAVHRLARGLGVASG